MVQHCYKFNSKEIIWIRSLWPMPRCYLLARQRNNCIGFDALNVILTRKCYLLKAWYASIVGWILYLTWYKALVMLGVVYYQFDTWLDLWCTFDFHITCKWWSYAKGSVEALFVGFYFQLLTFDLNAHVGIFHF